MKIIKISVELMGDYGVYGQEVIGYYANPDKAQAKVNELSDLYENDNNYRMDYGKPIIEEIEVEE